ncbi:MAG: tRNA 4-thiouridine(8) synthase ThiI [Clostridia bacterium]|nr:tRNA 4-thiouridine(8) synthase ThiI [Clostridiales bacterium]MBQ6716589.1 tRNA 4-thiouridine(8) synthase ThiI [Clostridia bacterium]
MRRVLLARFGEVHLKGNNRPYFLRTLVDNVRKAVEDIGGHVWMAESRIYVANATDMDECAERVRKVFGIYSVSPAIEMEKDLDAICRQAAEMMKGMRGSFKVLCKRSDKKFPLNSQELAAKVGESILEVNDKLVVDVHNPEIKMKIDIRDHAYLCNTETMAVGGLPMGTSGRAMLLLSGGIDSPVAGYQIMRRGVHVQSVHFASPPYTSERAREKVLTLAKKIGEYEYGMRVHMVPFTKIQMEIHEKCEDGLGTVIMRRAMMRIADRLAHENNCLGLITGESIGQVASQTMEALACTDAVATMPVFRPLIGMDKLSIIRIAEGIDTYETSILPYEDCCTVFTPRHPVTKPKIDKVEKEEARLDLENLIEEAIQNTEILFLKD